VNKKPNQNKQPNEQNQLRKKAEAQLAHAPQTEVPARSAEELLHELRVQHIELEIQNEELRRAQVALEESRDRYLDLYEFAPVGYLTLSLDAEISEINFTGSGLLRVDRKKLLNRHFSTFVSPEDRDRWHQIFMHTVQHDDNQCCEMVLQRGDGSLFHAQLDNIHLWKEGDVPTVHLTIIDISRSNQAQASERRLGLIMDNTLDMIFVFEPNSLRFVYANKGAVGAIGYNREELLQMSPPDVLQLVSEPECRSFIAPLSSGKKRVRRFETMLRCKNGKDLPVEVQLQLVQEDDAPGLFVSILRDITRRKNAERAMRRQKNLMWQVIDTDPNKIFVKDEHGKFLLANQSMADYYGVAIPDMIGKINSELSFNRQEAAKFLAADQDVIENGREVVLTEMLMKDGKQNWFHTVKRPLFQDDGSVHELGIAVDVTELKVAANKLAESYKELQRLALYQENVREEERAKIARNLHDEMGATLAALKMRIAWLASKLPQEMPKLAAEADHLSELVSNGIKTMRQVVSELRPNLLDEVGLIEAVRNYARRFQHDTEIECRVVLPENNFSLDENQSVTVFRIIQESLNNVVKHALASEVEIRFALLNESLLLQIMDNGIGFEPAKKSHTFGLLGIKERALMIGGEARIDSAPGLGTQVRLSIPIIPDVQSELNYS
jgi:PAS domain S-box-containing protein